MDEVTHEWIKKQKVSETQFAARNTVYEPLPVGPLASSSKNALVAVKQEVGEEILGGDIQEEDVIYKEEHLPDFQDDERSVYFFAVQIKEEDHFEKNNGQDVSFQSDSMEKSNSAPKSREPVRISALMSPSEAKSSIETKFADKNKKCPTNVDPAKSDDERSTEDIEAQPPQVDKSNLKSNLERYKVCPICNTKQSSLKRHLNTQHKLEKEEIEKIMFRERKRKDKKGNGRLCPMKSCAGLQGYQRLSQHLRKVHGLTTKLEIYRKHLKIRRERTSILNESTNQILSDFEILNVSTINILSDFETYLVPNRGNDSDKKNAKQKRTKVQQIMTDLGFHPSDIFCPENENKMKSWFLNYGETRKHGSALTYLYNFKSFINYLMTVPDSKISRESVEKMLVNIKSWVEIVDKKKKKEPSNSTEDLNTKDLSILLNSDFAHRFNELTKKWGKADFNFTAGSGYYDWKKNNHSLVRNFITLETFLRTPCRPATLANITMKELNNCKIQGQKYILHVSELKSNISNGTALIILNKEIYFKYLTYAHIIRPNLNPNNQYLFQRWSGEHIGPDDIHNGLKNLWDKCGLKSKFSTKGLRKTITTNVHIPNSYAHSIAEKWCKTNKDVSNIIEASDMAHNILVNPVKDYRSNHKNILVLSDEEKKSEINISENNKYDMFEPEKNISEKNKIFEMIKEDEKLDEKNSPLVNLAKNYGSRPRYIGISSVKEKISKMNISVNDEYDMFEADKIDEIKMKGNTQTNISEINENFERISDLKSKLERYKVCPICKTKQSSLKRHLYTQHKLEKEGIEKIMFRERKRKDKKGYGRLCPMASCAGLQGYQRLSQHLKKVHGLNSEHEIYRKHMKIRKEKWCTANRNVTNMMNASDMVHNILINPVKDNRSNPNNISVLLNEEKNSEVNISKNSKYVFEPEINISEKNKNLEMINDDEKMDENMSEQLNPVKGIGGKPKSLSISSIKGQKSKMDISENIEYSMFKCEKMDEIKIKGTPEINEKFERIDEGEEIARIYNKIDNIIDSEISKRNKNVDMIEEGEEMDEEMAKIFNMIDNEIESKVHKISDKDYEINLSESTNKQKLMLEYRSLLPELDETRGQKSKTFSRNQKILIFSGFIEYIHDNDKKPTVKYINDKIQIDPGLFFLKNTEKYSVPKIQGVLLNFLNKKKREEQKLQKDFE